MTAMNFVQQALLAGIAATVALDLWQLLVQQVFRVPATNWAMVGRWFSHLPRRTVRHQAIGEAEPVQFETATGWIAHYLVGLGYAVVYLILVGPLLGTGPSLATAFGFGVISVVMPWFFMQPCVGLGVMARKAPKPGVVRAHSFSSHVAFGVGLYVPALICILDSLTGEAPGTETIRYGQRVDVLSLPAADIMTSAEGLAWVGPRGFGYDLDFITLHPESS